MSRAAMVVNPTKSGDLDVLWRRSRAVMDGLGWARPLWLETSPTDPGLDMAARGVREAVDVVFACGGDGTVRACATALAGTGVPLAILPLGTGNLLARNLGVPTNLVDALLIGMTGADRRIDVGVVDGLRFVVMAGIGFDAAMLAGASDTLKAHVGPLAYLASALGHLRDRPMHIAVSIGDGPPLYRRASAVLVANVGILQAGVLLAPGARPDDGVLDVAVLDAGGLAGWVRLAGEVVLGRRGDTSRITRLQASTVSITTREAQPRELDGDPVAASHSLVVTVEPGALLVRVPHRKR